jgi:hypothetical protein
LKLAALRFLAPADVFGLLALDFKQLGFSLLLERSFVCG